jgi:hypothetical protein
VGISVADPKKIFFGFGSKHFFSDSDRDSDSTQVVQEIGNQFFMKMY